MLPPPPRATLFPYTTLFRSPGGPSELNATCKAYFALKLAGDSTEARHQFQSEIRFARRSEEHTSELQSRLHLVCRLLLEKKKKQKRTTQIIYQHTTRHHYSL